MPPTDLILSYGDLIRQSGYRTRVLGELLHLEKTSSLEPLLLAFDRQAGASVPDDFGGVPACIRRRHASFYYSEILRLSRKRRIGVVHAHNLYSAALALSTRALFGYKVLLDLHGRIPEEYVFLGKGTKTSRALLNALERWCVTRSDHVVTVSNSLRRYLRETYRLDDSNVSVIPCCTDGKQFRWSPDVRRSERARLNLSDRFVCTHLGSMLEWYRPEAIIGAFCEIRRCMPSAHLLVVTGDVEAATSHLKPHLRSDVFTVTRSKHRDVPALLNASDLGLLLLPDTANIHTSSPTKFSEYLNCGLPVLISSHVGDYSDLVAASDVGYVVTRDRPVDANFLSALIDSRETFAERCVRAGATLTWQRYTDAWNGIIEKFGHD